MKPFLLLAALTVSLSACAKEIAINTSEELKRGFKTAQPGDEIVIKDGIWTNAQIKFEAHGTAERPVTLRAQTPGKVVFTGNSWVKIGGEHLIVRGLLFKDGACPGSDAIAFRSNRERPARHCRVTDCAVIGYNPPTPEGKSYWVSLYGISNRVDHCRFEGKNDGGPTLTVWLEGTEPNHHQIDHNYFLHRPKLGRNGGETMRIGDSDTSMLASRTLVEENMFEDCSGEAEFISNKSCENLYRRNTFLASKGALVLRHGNRNTVEGNWFFGKNVPGTGGVRLIGEDQRVFNNYFDGLAGKDFESALPVVDGIPDTKANGYFQVQHAVVAFNTWVDCAEPITFGVGTGERKRSQPARDCVFANNVIVGTNGPLVRVQHEPENLKWTGNVFRGAATGLPATPGVTSDLDPKMTRGADGIARPAPTSGILGRAAGDFSFVTEDLEGRPRTGAKDPGCFQSSGTPTRKPITVREVGPAWTTR